MQSVPITTDVNVVSSNLDLVEVYLIQHYMIKSLSVTYDRSVVFSGYYDITEILLKVALKTINQT